MHDGQLTVHYFTARKSPLLRYKLFMPHGPEQLKNKGLDIKVDYNVLSAVAYRPMVNPLKGKTVGADRSAPIALLRFSRWEGTEAEVWISNDFHSLQAGDVISNIHIPADPPILLACNQRHRWWIPTPEPLADSSDIPKLPLKTQQEKSSSSGSAAAAITGERLTNPNSPHSGIISDLENNVEQIKIFLAAHHEKALNMRGTVRRGSIRIEWRGNAPTDASYIMEHEWQNADGSKGKSAFQVFVTLQKDSNGLWKIIKQRSEPLK